MSTQGHFEYNVGYHNPVAKRISQLYTKATTDKVKAQSWLNRLKSVDVFDPEQDKVVSVPTFLVNRFIPPWTEMPPEADHG